MGWVRVESKIIMKVYLNKNNEIILSTDENHQYVIDEVIANDISKLQDKKYYYQDILTHFKEDRDYSKIILKDEGVLEDVLNLYTEYRMNADGGCYEDNRHWKECLTDAINDLGIIAYKCDKELKMCAVEICYCILILGLEKPEIKDKEVADCVENLLNKGEDSFKKYYDFLLTEEQKLKGVFTDEKKS